MSSESIDLNADVGEEVGDDETLMRIVTSANVACGFHAGSAQVMRRVCGWAAEHGVALGAHVAYDDRAGFGRVPRDVPATVLSDQIAVQVGRLEEAARSAGATVSYLKPHGALYHRVAHDEDQAAAVLAGSGRLPVLAMPGSLIVQMAIGHGRPTAHEGFPDRGYGHDGRLLDRSLQGAVLTEPESVAAQALRLARLVDSLCLHGDTPGAVGHARTVRRRLEASGWGIARHF